VLCVTERRVFKLTPDGLELIEVAPGVDIERDILARMEFRPIIRNLNGFARPGCCECRLSDGSPYHAGENRFFVNLEGHGVHKDQDAEAIRGTERGPGT
jgi:propionate CoA-transferase